MKKLALIAVAGFLSLASTAALADGFYFGFTQQSAPRTVYVAPRPVYVAPRQVYVPAPRAVYYSPRPMMVNYVAPRHYDNCQWNDHRGHNHNQSYYYRGGRGHY